MALDAQCVLALGPLNEQDARCLALLTSNPGGLRAEERTDEEAVALVGLGMRGLTTIEGQEWGQRRVRFWHITPAGRAALQAHEGVG